MEEDRWAFYEAHRLNRFNEQVFFSQSRLNQQLEKIKQISNPNPQIKDFSKKKRK